MAEKRASGEETLDPTSPSGQAQSRMTRDEIAGMAQDQPIENAPPPAYSTSYGLVDMVGDGLNTHARVADDGRVNINIDQKSSTLSNLLVPAFRSQLNLQQVDESADLPPGYIPASLGGAPGQTPPPPMNVVIHVVGSRGDVQPFVALGKVLKETYGHRVRLATHPTFRTFVEENGLEFFSISGDPAELMAFMVKNPGLMPGKDALKSGDIGKRRKGMYDIIRGCWRSCFEAGDGTGVEVSDAQAIHAQNLSSYSDDPSHRPFVADAIIANPPSFAHLHCAEKLGIPLHLMFTMPWSPTQAFPHPLANIQSSNADANMTNFISYALVEMMTWQGLGDVINRFREKSLGLEPISLIWAPGMASRLKIPYTYCWSPALISKPGDWGAHISVSGFYFLNLASNYSPQRELADFLAAGPPPVYIGFGSIVVDDPNALTKLIFEAVKKTGQRALVSKGWGGFGADEAGIPEGVFMLGNVPHDWLFNHVSCVVHHGGAGTTAAGIATGKPTVVVPFFGDQPFWGAMIARAGAGPSPIPNKKLTAENLAEAIKEALKPTTLERAKELGQKIATEKGAESGAQSFHGALDMDNMRCSLAPSRAAVWRVKRTQIRLSALAAAVLGKEGLLDFGDLKLHRSKEYDVEDGPWDPIIGGASALVGTMGSMMMGIADFPVEIFKAMSHKDNRPGVSTPVHSSGPSEPTLSGNTSSATSIRRKDSSTETGGSGEGASLAPSNSSILSSTPPPSTRQGVGGTSGTGFPHECDAAQISLATALGTGKGVGRIVSAGLKSPMDFTLALAKGFHNAPKLYGDTVRPAERITGLQSGLRAAGKEFGFGFYDGIAGLVTQPMEGAKNEGFAGFMKGFGRGIGGVVLKPGAAIWGLPGYTFMGIYKEIQKLYGSSVQNYILTARTAQGLEDWKKSSPQERADIIARWHAIHKEVQKHKRHFSLARKEHSHHNKKNKAGVETPDLEEDAQVQHIANADNREFEQAIRESIAATSTGNPNEDAMIERAIRASVMELRQAARDESINDQTMMQRALDASLADAQASTTSVSMAVPAQEPQQSQGQDPGTDHLNATREQYHLHHDLEDDSGIDTEDDEHIKATIERSKQDANSSKDDNDLQAALKASQADPRQSIGRTPSEEETIVLEYVKRQSLIEEEHRRNLPVREDKGSSA